MIPVEFDAFGLVFRVLHEHVLHAFVWSEYLLMTAVRRPLD